MPTRKIRFGILGCSRITQKSVLPAFRNSNFAEVAMIGSRSEEKARLCAAGYPGITCGTYEDVLSNSELDAVYISLPNALHEEWTIKAARAKKHVWCEKPAALSFASAQRAVESCRENRVRLREGFAFLAHPQHALVKRLLDEGAIGEVLSFEGRFAFPMPREGSNLRSPRLGGGTYYDSAVYPIRASRMALPETPESVSCFITKDDTGLDIRADMVIAYPGKVRAFISSAFGAYYQSSYRILGSEGVIRTERAYAVPADRSVSVFLEKNDAAEEFKIPAADQFGLFLDEFCKEIASGSITTHDDELLLQARIVEAGKKAAELGRILPLAEIL